MLKFKGTYLKTGRGSPNFKVCCRDVLRVAKMVINLVFTESQYFDKFFVFQIFLI